MGSAGLAFLLLCVTLSSAEQWSVASPGDATTITVSLQPEGDAADFELLVNFHGAFAVPTRGTWGNAGRNILRGPNLFQVDLSLQKRVAIGGERRVELRWEAFNAFNRENLANPNTNISSGVAFGRITGPLNLAYGTGTARQMQFMLRVNF